MSGRCQGQGDVQGEREEEMVKGKEIKKGRR